MNRVGAKQKLSNCKDLNFPSTAQEGAQKLIRKTETMATGKACRSYILSYSRLVCKKQPGFSAERRVGVEVGEGVKWGIGEVHFCVFFTQQQVPNIVGGQCPAAKSAACLPSWCSTATETIRLVTGGLLHF